MPFKSNSILGLYDKICNTPLEYPGDIFVSDSLKHLLAGLLEKDCQRRMSLADAVNHSWVTYNGELPLLTQSLVCSLKDTTVLAHSNPSKPMLCYNLNLY